MNNKQVVDFNSYKGLDLDCSLAIYDLLNCFKRYSINKTLTMKVVNNYDDSYNITFKDKLNGFIYEFKNVNMNSILNGLYKCEVHLYD